MSTILLAATAGSSSPSSAALKAGGKTPTGSTTLTNNAQDQMRVLDPATGTTLLSFRQSAAPPHGMVTIGGPGCVYRFGGRSGCDHIAVSQVDKPAVHFWSWGREQPRLRCSLPLRLGPMAVTPDGTYLIAGSHTGRMLVWNSLTGELVQAFDAHLKAIRCIKVLKDGSHVISGGDDSDVFVWNLADLLDGATNVSFVSQGVAHQKRKRRRTERSDIPLKMTTAYVDPVCTWSGHTLAVTDIHCGWSSARGQVITSSLDQTCKFWDVCENKMLHSIAFPSFLKCIVCDQEQRFLFAGGGDGIIYILNLRVVAKAKARSTAASFQVESGSRFSSFGSSSTKPGFSSSPTFPSDDSSMASSHMMEGHRGPVNCLAVGHGSGQLYSGGDDGTVIAWDVLSRQQLYQIDQAGPVTNLLLLPRPRDLLRNKSSSSADSSKLRPLPPLHKKMLRAEDSTGSCLGFLSASAGVEWQNKHVANGEGGAIRRAASLADEGLSSAEERSDKSAPDSLPSAVAQNNIATPQSDGFVEVNVAQPNAENGTIVAETSNDAATSLVARLAELEEENRRWQALATKLRSMVPAAGSNAKRKK